VLNWKNLSFAVLDDRSVTEVFPVHGVSGEAGAVVVAQPTVRTVESTITDPHSRQNKRESVRGRRQCDTELMN
jgi:ammonia channel protein AmtB